MEEDVKIVCPLCKKEFVVKEEFDELEASNGCPKCGTDFVSSREAAEE